MRMRGSHRYECNLGNASISAEMMRQNPTHTHRFACLSVTLLQYNPYSFLPSACASNSGNKSCAAEQAENSGENISRGFSKRWLAAVFDQGKSQGLYNLSRGRRKVRALVTTEPW